MATNIDPAIVDNPHVREVLEGAYRDAGAGGLLRVRLHARVDTALAGLIAAAVDAARAEAWDEGYTAGISAPANRALGLGNPANPYREATP